MKVFLPEEGLRGAHFKNVAQCSARYLQQPKSQKWLLVDDIKCSAFADPNLTIRDVRTLAAQLSNIDPFRFGILQCYGIIKRSGKKSSTISSFDFVFEAPYQIEKEPSTLRSHLIQSTTHTLTKRFETARQLAKSVCYVHTLGFVHKNVRPENVVSFPTQGESLASFFLIGFDQARILERGTVLTGEQDWEKDFYRHPDRQGLEPRETYVMQHEISSLGVCLLEIGLWESFVEYEADGTTAKATAGLQIHVEHHEERYPQVLKEHLVSLARNRLPLHMGERYADVVVNCLTCLDADNVDFGDPQEFQDEDGVLVGVKYIEKVSLPFGSQLHCRD